MSDQNNGNGQKAKHPARSVSPARLLNIDHLQIGKSPSTLSELTINLHHNATVGTSHSGTTMESVDELLECHDDPEEAEAAYDKRCYNQNAGASD